MQNTLKISFKFIVLALVLASCGSNEGKVEYKRTYHRNGKVHEVIPIVNGRIHGIKYEYYEDGALRLETPYDSGYVYGNVRYFYPDGKLYSETPRVKGKIHGVVKKYHQNGVLLSETPYEEDILKVGLKEYDNRGRPREPYTLVFEEKKTLRGNELIVNLQASIAPAVQSVKFFQVIPSEGGTEVMIPFPVSDNTGQLTTILPKGSGIETLVKVRAEFVTRFHNRGVLEEVYYLRVQN